MPKLTPIIDESFTQYAGAVLQSRALVDVRDCIKPSARQIFYCMETDKFTADKPFRKTLKAIGSAMRLYIHGDSSCEGVIMRAGQPFAMRYPLVEVEGSYGNLMETGNWAAPRYTSARLSSIAGHLFDDIDKNTIADWRDNYDDTEQYPAVLPSKGYYNICNGSMGIGIGLSSSIPQFNLTEVNNALIKLLQNPDIDDNEIICLPDFATGACLLNAAEVRESLKVGSGKACQLRAQVEYDAKDNCFVVTQIPYGVYTNTICGELENILNEPDTNPGIERFNDLTGATPNIKIYLVKGANPETVVRFLYKNTSLQYWYAINLTMLQGGHRPKTYGWKAALQEHIDHEKVVYRKAFEYDLQKALDRLHIVEGILIALAHIDEVVEVIRSSESTQAANLALQANFNLDEVQAKAVLDIKLSRLAHLEVEKFEQEANSLKQQIAYINEILHSEKLFNEQLINGWKMVIKKYGDARRTVVVESEAATEEVKATPILNLVLNNNTVLPIEPEDKYNLAKKGSPFAKNKILFGYQTNTTDTSYLFDAAGKVYKLNNSTLSISVANQLPLAQFVCGIGALNGKWVVTLTRKGIIKKTLASEYHITRPTAGVKVREDDELMGAWCANDSDYVYIVGAAGGLVKFALSSVTPSGRATIGVKAIEDEVISAAVGPEEDLYLTCADGKGKYSHGTDFNLTARGAKGQVITDNTNLIAHLHSDIYVVENDIKLLHLTSATLSTKGKTAVGAKISDVKNLKAIV